MVVVRYNSRRNTNNGFTAGHRLEEWGDITHSYRKGTYLMGANDRRKRRKSYKCESVVTSKVNILISKSAEISRSAEK